MTGLLGIQKARFNGRVKGNKTLSKEQISWLRALGIKPDANKIQIAKAIKRNR